jgi:ABC-type dipeptide/oligopeptide/nickel transport system ATPase component
LPRGCSFADRCPFALAACRVDIPALRDVGERHQSACLRAPLDPEELLVPATEEATA